jgi:hypothetical protein
MEKIFKRVNRDLLLDSIERVKTPKSLKGYQYGGQKEYRKEVYREKVNGQEVNW